MADENCKKLLDWDKIWYSGFFGGADYESELNIQEFKMPPNEKTHVGRHT